jgi:hypothetical protein
VTWPRCQCWLDLGAVFSWVRAGLCFFLVLQPPGLSADVHWPSSRRRVRGFGGCINACGRGEWLSMSLSEKAAEKTGEKKTKIRIHLDPRPDQVQRGAGRWRYRVPGSKKRTEGDRTKCPCTRAVVATVEPGRRAGTWQQGCWYTV